MTKFKSLLLGSAGAAVLLTAGTVAQAADAPAAAKGREPVYRCEQTGFWEMPGTDICLKIGGYAKLDAIWNSEGNGDRDAFDAGGIDTNGTVKQKNDVSIHARQSRINFDARSNSEYGVVRSFIEGDFFTSTGNEVISNSRAFRLRHAFVQFGNLLAGQTWSSFTGLAGYSDTIDFGGSHAVTFIRQAQVRWTQPLGNGLTAIVAAENPEAVLRLSDPGNVSGRGFSNATVASNDDVPDGVLGFDYAQAWGVLQARGLIRGLRATGPGINDGTEIGWGVSLAGEIKAPLFNPKDNFKFYALYGESIGRYHLASALAGVPDAVVNPVTGNLETVESWGVTASFQHYWAPIMNIENLRSTVMVAYSEFDDEGGLVDGNAAEKLYGVWGNLIWTPAPKLDIGVEVIYGKRENQDNNSGTAWQGRFAVQRSF